MQVNFLPSGRFNTLSTTPRGSKPSKFTPEDISPELAAYVVRTYLLPMFETDVKKHQRRARQKLLGNGAASLSPHKDEKSAFHGLPDSNTVYGELMLSDKLQIEIYALREDKARLQEQVESLGYKNS
jgi:hypothetical protein